MRNIILRFFILYSLFVFNVSEVEAIRVKESYKYRLPDGSVISLVSQGDEFFHYTTTIRGDVVSQKQDGFYYYASLDANGISVSNIRVGGVYTDKMLYFTNVSSDGYDIPTLSSMRSDRLPDVITKRSAVVTKSGSYGEYAKAKYDVLIIPVQFSDTRFTINNPAPYFRRMANERNFSDNGATGSLKDYFDDNIKQYDFNFIVSDVVTLDKGRAYYGENSYLGRDMNLNELVYEASLKVSQNGVNFSRFDNNGDGQVDQVCFIYAGHGEAEGGGEHTIWPVMDRLYNKSFKISGVLIDSYVCVPELKGSNTSSAVAGIGTFCHEFGHALGLPDFYDLNGYLEGLTISYQESISLMDKGWQNNGGNTPPYLNAIEREHLGIANIREITAGEYVELEPGYMNSTVIKVVSKYNRDEFFLLECRKKVGWDSYITGEGLAVYHVDKSYRDVAGISAKDRWEINLLNTFSAHQCAYMVCSYSEVKGSDYAFFPGKGGVTEFSVTSTPAFVDWSGMSLGVALTDIRFNGEKVTFNVNEELQSRNPDITSHKIVVYQKDAYIDWTTDMLFDAKWIVEWNREELFDAGRKSDIASYNRYRLKNLEPDKRYRCNIYFNSSQEVRDTLKLSFKTQPITASYPRIDGVNNSHPVYEEMRLKVLNLNEEVFQIKWRIDGKTLFDDRYTPETQGEITISAEIIYLKDRSSEIITKRVVIL